MLFALVDQNDAINITYNLEHKSVLSSLGSHRFSIWLKRMAHSRTHKHTHRSSKGGIEERGNCIDFVQTNIVNWVFLKHSYDLSFSWENSSSKILLDNLQMSPGWRDPPEDIGKSMKIGKLSWYHNKCYAYDDSQLFSNTCNNPKFTARNFTRYILESFVLPIRHCIYCNASNGSWLKCDRNEVWSNNTNNNTTPLYC